MYPKLFDGGFPVAPGTPSEGQINLPDSLPETKRSVWDSTCVHVNMYHKSCGYFCDRRYATFDSGLIAD